MRALWAQWGVFLPSPILRALLAPFLLAWLLGRIVYLKITGSR